MSHTYRSKTGYWIINIVNSLSRLEILALLRLALAGTRLPIRRSLFVKLK